MSTDGPRSARRDSKGVSANVAHAAVRAMRYSGLPLPSHIYLLLSCPTHLSYCRPVCSLRLQAPDEPQQAVDLRKARRKLSVMSDNLLVDGISDIRLDETFSRSAQHGTELACAVSSYAGSSKKGFAPYNNRKKNQDALIMYVLL